MQRGRSIGRTLKLGMSVALVGGLGSGKTVLVKGIAGGLGLKDQNEVKSPTFVILHVYQGRVPLYHFDFYRLEEVKDLEEIGLREFLSDPQAVSVAEWADRVPEIVRDADVRIDMSITGETTREISLTVKKGLKLRVSKSL